VLLHASNKFDGQVVLTRTRSYSIILHIILSSVSINKYIYQVHYQTKKSSTYQFRNSINLDAICADFWRRTRSWTMAPQRKRPQDPAARARFQELAVEAQRLGLYRHGLVGRKRFTVAIVDKHGEEMWRLHQEGATHKELAAIFGYATSRSIYTLLKRIQQGRQTDESLSSESGAKEADSGSEGTVEDSNPAPEEGEDPAQRRFSTPFWAAFARRTQDQSVDTPTDVYKSRHVRGCSSC
jgi:hypothetical protein